MAYWIGNQKWGAYIRESEVKGCLDEQENRSGRQNIRAVGITEGTEGHNPTEFMATFLQDVLGGETFDRPPVIDRAHHPLAVKPQPGCPSRAMLVRLHYFQTKEKIIRTSRKRGQLNYNGKQIHFFPDYSADLGRRRAAYKDVKAHLHKVGVRFGLIHPAKLRITFQGASHTLKMPQSALTFYRDNIHSTAAQNPEPWKVASCVIRVHPWSVYRHGRE